MCTLLNSILWKYKKQIISCWFFVEKFIVFLILFFTIIFLSKSYSLNLNNNFKKKTHPVIINDTILEYDTVYVYDTITNDEITKNDTLIEYEWIIEYDTLVVKDTITVLNPLDSTFSVYFGKLAWKNYSNKKKRFKNKTTKTQLRTSQKKQLIPYKSKETEESFFYFPYPFGKRSLIKNNSICIENAVAYFVGIEEENKKFAQEKIDTTYKYKISIETKITEVIVDSFYQVVNNDTVVKYITKNEFQHFYNKTVEENYISSKLIPRYYYNRLEFPFLMVWYLKKKPFLFKIKHGFSFDFSENTIWFDIPFEKQKDLPISKKWFRAELWANLNFEFKLNFSPQTSLNFDFYLRQYLHSYQFDSNFPFYNKKQSFRFFVKFSHKF